VKSIVLANVLLVLFCAVYFVFVVHQEPSPDSWSPSSSLSKLPPIRFERVKTNGIELNVLSAGPTDGPVVILLHGFPETALLSWHHQIGPLANAGLHVVVPDQRGYNTSDKPQGISSYSADNLVRDIIGVLDHFHASDAFIVGHDWGGVVAWNLAIRHPERVKKLIILNAPHPGAFLPYATSHPSQLLKSWYIFFFQMPLIPEWYFSRENFRVGRATMAGSSIKGKTFSRDEISRFIQAWSEKGAVTSTINWYRAAIQIEILKRPNEPAIVQPSTLIIWGERDIALEKGLAEHSLELCEMGSALYFEDATHWVQHDKPAEVTQAILDFIRI